MYRVLRRSCSGEKNDQQENGNLRNRKHLAMPVLGGHKLVTGR